MEGQRTIRFPKDLDKVLRDRAAKMQRKPSELVRMPVKKFLKISPDPKERPAERVRDLIGSLRSGVPDLALHHREHILEKLPRGK